MTAPTITQVVLDGPTDWPGFRRAVRALVATATPPSAVHFVWPGSEQADLFDNAQPVAQAAAPRAERSAGSAAPAASAASAVLAASTTSAAAPPALSLPAGFVALCETVVLHDDPQRFARLYALAHALHHGHAVWADTLSPQRIALAHMAQAVRREVHKTKAFVRFRPVHGEDGVTHVAWFEPAHHTLRAVAPFFMRRFAGMRWALLTPRGSAHWSGTALHFGPPADRASAPGPDAGEALWLVYYRSIFNPARLKLAMMKREMPVRFWANLPEAHSIATLAAAAGDRTRHMVDAAPTPRTRRRSTACDTQALGHSGRLHKPGDANQTNQTNQTEAREEREDLERPVLLGP